MTKSRWFKIAQPIVAIALCGMGLALILRANSDAGSYPNDPEDRELFICTKDNTVFERTPREIHLAGKSVAGGVQVGMTVCPTCQQPIARRAERRDGKVVPLPKTEMERIYDPTNKGAAATGG